ncbi:MAG: tRNA lysidine(34) synthetase TilS [Muribaculaceae bacterium]|nr:tRNA lysidine(34) synthetase TilS [Muribaculaceae bacterium]
MEHDEFVARVREYIAGHTLLEMAQRPRPVLVALSGGADSVALLRVLLELGCHCVAAHCNFHLRGEEAMRDEQFVRALCRQLQVPVVVRDFDVPLYRDTHRVSVEVACRDLRYAWFRQEAARQGAQAIAVAHHIDDNIETMLLNLLRGTGIAGLTGMKPMNRDVVRPLLCVTRADVHDYLDALAQDYVTDSTNLQCDYTRNKIRNIIIPAIEREFPQARVALATTVSNLADVEQLSTAYIHEILNGNHTPFGYRLNQFLEYPCPKLLVHAALGPCGFSMSQCDAIVACLRTKPKNRPKFFSATHCVTLGPTEAFVEVLGDCATGDCAFNPFDTSSLPIDIDVSFDNPPFDPSLCDGKRVVAFSREILCCKTLWLRHCHRGDAMRPFGMHGTRKVSDILTGAHYTWLKKRNTFLLEADGEILWVVGVRSAEAFRVNPGSTSYLLLTCKEPI